MSFSILLFATAQRKHLDKIRFRYNGLHYCISLIKCILDTIGEISPLDISVLLNEMR